MSQGNTICKTGSLDWYTNAVGETPCQTYQRLRQICNAGYTVGSLSTSTPGDRCDEQLANCCCNSVSFALSMLCLNCQQGVGTGLNGDNGYDAGIGAYQIYLGACRPQTNQSLPNDIQAAVCNEKIKIDDALYGLFWHDGSWFYMYTRETIQKNQKANANDVYTHCGSTISNGTSTNINLSSSATSITVATSTSTAASSVQPIAGNKTSSLTVGTISGIAVGGVVAAVLFVSVVFWLLQRRRRHEGSQPNHYSRPEMQHIAEPFTSFKFPSNGPSAASIPHPFLVPSDSNSHLLAKGRSMKRRQTIIQSRPETDNSLSTTHLPAGYAPISNVSGPSIPESQLLPGVAERHIDGGPQLERSPSGRLPPAYEEQFVTAMGGT